MLKYAGLDADGILRGALEALGASESVISEVRA
jgi:hypothetical protein